MAYNEKFTEQVREALIDIPRVKEKKMFRGITFLVNDKMCISVNDEEIMCRIGPDKFEEALEREGCRPMIHGGRTMKGFVFVDQDVLGSKKKLDYWIGLCLAYNKQAKSSKTKRINQAKKKER